MQGMQAEKDLQSGRGKHEDYIPELEKLLNDRKLLKQMDENVRHARKEMIDVSLDKAVEIMEERMTA